MPDWKPILMENSGNASVGKLDWRPYPMGHYGNRTEKNPEWQLTLTRNKQKIRVDQQKGHTPPMGTTYKAADYQPSLTGINCRDKLGVPDWSPTPVKMGDGKLQTKKVSTSATDTV